MFISVHFRRRTNPSDGGRGQVNRYLIIVEETPSGYSAYSPDVPGCVAAAFTRSEVEREMRDAIEFHIEGLRAADQIVSSELIVDRGNLRWPDSVPKAEEQRI